MQVKTLIGVGLIGLIGAAGGGWWMRERSNSERALAVVRILNGMAAQYRAAIIVVTHDEKIIPTFRRIYHIRDGKTHEEAGEGREP